MSFFPWFPRSNNYPQPFEGESGALGLQNFVSEMKLPNVPFWVMGQSAGITSMAWSEKLQKAMPIGEFIWSNVTDSPRGLVDIGATSATQKLDVNHPFAIGDRATHKFLSGPNAGQYNVFNLQVLNVVGQDVTFDQVITTLTGDALIKEHTYQELEGVINEASVSQSVFFDNGLVVSGEANEFGNCTLWPNDFANNLQVLIATTWDGQLFNNFANDGAFALFGYDHDSSTKLGASGFSRIAGAWRKVVGYDLHTGPTYGFSGTMTQPTTPGFTDVRSGMIMGHYGVASGNYFFAGNSFSSTNAVLPAGPFAPFPVTAAMALTTPIGPMTFGCRNGTVGPAGQLAMVVQSSFSFWRMTQL